MARSAIHMMELMILEYEVCFFGTQFSDAQCRDFHELSLVNSELRRVYHFSPKLLHSVFDQFATIP